MNYRLMSRALLIKQDYYRQDILDISSFSIPFSQRRQDIEWVKRQMLFSPSYQMVKKENVNE